MAIKFKLKVFRKPFHWTKERYEIFIKENNYFKTIKDLKQSLKSLEKKE